MIPTVGTKKKIINSRSYPAGGEGEGNSSLAVELADFHRQSKSGVSSKMHLSTFSYLYRGLLKTVSVQHSVLICFNDQRLWVELKSLSLMLHR